jgi:hypothetical protein
MINDTYRQDLAIGCLMWMYLAACGDFDGSSSEARPIIDTTLQLASAVSPYCGRYFSLGRVVSR